MKAWIVRLVPLVSAMLSAGMPLVSPGAPKLAPEGMVWIPGGQFMMGSESSGSRRNEQPAHKVTVDGFWLDAHNVTNAEFRKFVEATGYQTTAERPVDWEEIKKQVPPGTPKPPDEMLRPGSLVFTSLQGAVDLRDMNAWWSWKPGANWWHPEGPASNLEGREDHPVVHVSWDDAVAYANGWANGFQRRRIGNSRREAVWKTEGSRGAMSSSRVVSSWRTRGQASFLTGTQKRTVTNALHR